MVGSFNLPCVFIYLLLGSTDGIDLSSDAVLKHSDQDLTAENTFTNGFHVEGNLTATGLIDTVNVAVLAASVVLTDVYQVIEGAWQFQNNILVYGEKIFPTLKEAIRSIFLCV